MAQELLTTFEQELAGVTLCPGDGGVFDVRVIPAADAAGPDRTPLVWSRADEGGFPEIKVLKQRVRDQIAPERDLGHSDRSEDSSASS